MKSKRTIKDFLNSKLINDSEWKEYQELKEMKEDYSLELEENCKLSELLCKCRKENKKLQQRIDEAIEYITTEQLYTNYQWGKTLYSKILKDLLNILKGENEDE